MSGEVASPRSAPACCSSIDGDLSDTEAGTIAELFKALADPHRVRIVNLLVTRAEPVCVCDLTALLDRSQPTVSHHLKKLVGAGLLRREQRGVWAYYSIDRDAMRRLAAVVDLQATEQGASR
jgi:ArsR family transcriptional regulator